MTDGTVTEAPAAAAPAPAAATEMAEIVSLMRNDRPAYDRNEPLQARYRELLDPGARVDAPAVEESATREVRELPSGAAPIQGGATLEALKAGRFEPAEIQAVIDWVHNDSKLPAHELAAIDESSKASTRAELSQLWGASKVAENLKAIGDYVDGHFPAGVAFAIKNARDADGKAFANNPAFLQRLLGLAKQTPTRGSGAGNVDAQIAEIVATMRNDRPAYDRNEQLQARYRELLVQKYGS